jgi:hypothetical protein
MSSQNESCSPKNTRHSLKPISRKFSTIAVQNQNVRESYGASLAPVLIKKKRVKKHVIVDSHPVIDIKTIF